MSLPEDDAPAGVPEWVVTYGDMMSLLLTFFIMLVSMSEMREDGQYQAMLDALQERFGPNAGFWGSPGRSLNSNSIFDQKNSTGTRSEGGTKARSRTSAGAGGAHPTVTRISHGTVVTLGGPAMFHPFAAELTPQLKETLDTLVEVLQGHPNRIMVKGHASAEPLPPDSAFRDPLDLSFARAHSVAHYLADHGIDSSRLLVTAVGDAEPRIRSRNPEDHNANRRVDVFLMDSYISPSNSSESADP